MRRIVFIVVAISMENDPLFQIDIFNLLSFGALIYMSAADIFTSKGQFLIEFINEVMIFFIGMVCIALLVNGITVDDRLTIGQFMNQVIYFKLALNGVLIITSLSLSIKDSCRKKRQAKLKKRHKELLA